MAFGYKHGSSGGGERLNFIVVNSATEPSSPRENTIWVKCDYSMHRWDISPTQPCRVGKKNLIVYPYYETTHTEDGITFTDNGDGTVTANGTATAESNFRFSYTSAESGMFILTPGTYTLSGCPSGGSSSAYALLLSRLNDSGSWEIYQRDYGSGKTFTIERDTYCCVLFRVFKGATAAGMTVRPMLEKGSAASSFARGNATGQVWIKTDPIGSVSMNAIRKNGITVQPVSAYEYTTNNGWRSRDAQVYQNGAWKALEELEEPWDGYYFKDGEQYTDVTGGWTTDGWNNIGTVTVGTTIAVSGPSMISTKNTVDLTSAKTLWFDSPNGNNGYNFGYLCVTSAKSVADTYIATSVQVKAGKGSVDVSSLSGKYYIVLYAPSLTGGASYADVRAVWME